MEVHGMLLKQPSDNVRSCSGRICPRPRELSSTRNCSASCSRTANAANHSTVLYSVNLCNFMWSCSMKLICLASHSASCFVQICWSIIYHPLPQFYVSYNVFLSPWTITKCTLHIYNTTHYIQLLCKNPKVSLWLFNVDRSSFISAFSYITLYPLDVYSKMPSL